jgi:hypothetical protein
LGSESPEDIVKAISTLDLSGVDEESMLILAGLPVLIKSNRAVDCWLQWADDNDESKLTERLQQFNNRKPTSRSSVLRTSQPRTELLHNSNHFVDVAMHGDDMIVWGPN